MRFVLIFLASIMLSPTAGYAHSDCAKAKCEETKHKIEKIQAKMRQGYTRAKGERWKRNSAVFVRSGPNAAVSR